MTRPWALFTKQRVLDAIDGCYGIVSHVARKLGGCSWITAKRYIDHWAETRQAFEDEHERALDFSETQMIAQIRQGDGPMIRFHLSTKGKKRGYTQQHDFSGWLANLDLSRLTDEQLERIANGEDPVAVLADAGQS